MLTKGSKMHVQSASDPLSVQFVAHLLKHFAELVRWRLLQFKAFPFFHSRGLWNFTFQNVLANWHWPCCKRNVRISWCVSYASISIAITINNFRRWYVQRSYQTAALCSLTLIVENNGGQSAINPITSPKIQTSLPKGVASLTSTVPMVASLSTIFLSTDIVLMKEGVK